MSASTCALTLFRFRLKGVASALRLAAEWESTGPVSTDADDKSSARRTAFSETRHLTWVAGPGEAIVRTSFAQARADEETRDRRPRIEALRTLNDGRLEVTPEDVRAVMPLAGSADARPSDRVELPSNAPKEFE